MTLQEQMSALIAEHDLSSLSIIAMAPLPAAGYDGVWFSANAQGSGLCCFNNGADTRNEPGAAIIAAITDLIRLRTKAVIVPSLEAAPLAIAAE